MGFQGATIVFKNWPAFFIGLALFVNTAALADGSADDLSRLIGQPENISPDPLAAKKENTAQENTALRLMLNKNLLIRLDQDAASVIVNNPSHVSVMLDSPRLIILVPHLPGATSFTVLDEKGATIMQKDIIVSANAQPEYVRIRRMCGSDDASCVPAAYFYCPDGCYEVTPVTPPGGGAVPAPAGGIAEGAALLAPADMSNDAVPPSESEGSTP